MGNGAETTRSPLAKTVQQEEVDNQTSQGNDAQASKTVQQEELDNQTSQANDAQASSAEEVNISVVEDPILAAPDNAGSKFRPTTGLIREHAKSCIASYPARFGDFKPPVVDGVQYPDAHLAVSQWEKITSLKGFSHACVWTGKDDSKMSEWFEPWKLNIKLAAEKGQKLMFCILPKHYGGEQIGRGQTIEKEYLDKHNIKYEVEEIDFNKVTMWVLMDTQERLPAKSCLDTVGKEAQYLRVDRQGRYLR